MSALATELARRLGPFLALLDARYLPLLFAVVPQAHAVYAWLAASGAPEEICWMGAIGFEVIYVGAIAWSDHGAGWSAARIPAVTALVFSSAVSVAHYAPTQGALAVLHVGFPLVAYAYTVLMHAPHSTRPQHAPHDAPAPSTQITNTVQVAVAPQPAPPALSDARAPTMPALSAHPGSHACKKCGASVASPQAVAASARWGCAGCKEK
jgi:hypothetical protein